MVIIGVNKKGFKSLNRELEVEEEEIQSEYKFRRENWNKSHYLHFFLLKYQQEKRVDLT
jgi:hypothetical protein